MRIHTPKREKTGYVSEFARFMNDYLEHHPEVTDDQKTGRGLYWDKKVEAADIDSAQRDNVPIDSYYYFGKF
jgi:hypothetical protein